MQHDVIFARLDARVREFIGRTSQPPPASEQMLDSRSEAEFDLLAQAVFAAQYEAVAPYARLCEARGLRPGQARRWQDIPCVPTAAFKEYLFTSLAPQERIRVFLSSGTTQQRPSQHLHSASSLALYEASLDAGFVAAGLGQVARPDQADAPASGAKPTFVSLTPSPDLAPHSSLVHMFATLAQRFGSAASRFVGDIVAPAPQSRPLGGTAGGITHLPALDHEPLRQGAPHFDSDSSQPFPAPSTAVQPGWTLDLEAAKALLGEAVITERPVFLLGTAFSYVSLFDGLAAEGRRYQLPPSSRVLETGGYKGRSRALSKAELHQLMAYYLGVVPAQIVGEYGMSELSSQAYDVASAGPVPASTAEAEAGPRRFRFRPWARALVVSPETGCEVGEGETGLLRVFDLANLRSVMALQTEDLVVRWGHGFELIGRAPQAEARGCSLMVRSDFRP